MRVIDCIQGSPEWVQARLGIPTSSCFSDIVTKSGKRSGSAARYRDRLIAEWFLGMELDDGKTRFMERGTQMESEAVSWFEFEHDTDTATVGLCLHDDLDAGASPDRLVGDDGLLEVKVPTPAIQVGYLLDDPPQQYLQQVQGQLWVTGRKWCRLLCYNPALPKVEVLIERDETFIEKLAAEVETFCAELEAARTKLAGPKAERDAKAAELQDADHGF